ncbi:phenylacetate--CoA ligase family protein [Nocardioides marmotae]|uniref:phenylacetate--CoA ligase family protein n=1 Tax=Nocardioides marmotae TaxID=2663857 RepID=UPI0012B61E95|nr:AMP-binding protein [Nocardioides marmotae]MBC9734304.1 AMP-binding protein [Nocardioides marmotae]MTB85405.1 AMP-binding protein [Nocardioides marmotae]
MATTQGPRSTATDERGFPRFWDEERETMPRDRRDELVLARIQHQLRYVYDELPFYRRHYDAHGFHPDDVKTLEDFTRKVPVITKKMLVADQQANPPFGSYTPEIPAADLARVHGSSGTSGVPTLYGVSRRDWDRAADVHAMAQWCGGVRPSDLVQVGFPFGLFFGGWGVVQGVERIGAALFPLGVAESEKHLEFLERLRPTVFSGTPSYCMHLISVAQEAGVDLRESSVRTLLVGGEPGGSLPGTRQILEEAWGATLVDAGSTSEMYPFQTNVGCEAKTGTHIISDEVFPEIVDKDDLNVPVPEGDRGAVVYTHLWRESQPMIRFAPGDESYLTHDPCPCGRTYPRLPEGVLGRLDDMLVIRGANIFPSAIETALRSVGGFGPEFEIRVSKRGALDEILVRAEYDPGATAGDAASTEALRARGEATLKRITGIRVPVEVIAPGSLPATVFKARRVVDERARA